MGARRHRSHRAVWALFLAAALAVPALSSGDAEARRKRRRRAPQAQVNAEALGQLMGQFKFGMTRQEVLKVLAKDIGKRYQERIEATTDVYTQDKLRRQRKAEVAKIKNSYREFTGKKTGWDVSIIDDQFAHNTGESMMVYWENEAGSGKDQRRFFFFHEGRLYKMFIALNSAMLKDEQKKFSYFQSLMERRYGPAKVEYVTDRHGVESPKRLEWRTAKYHVAAVDKLSFYGSFVLVISDPDTEKLVAEIRDANKKPKRENAVIQSIIEGEDDAPPSLDSGKANVDAILKN